jgi:hypothetical protein
MSIRSTAKAATVTTTAAPDEDYNYKRKCCIAHLPLSLYRYLV